MTKLEFDRQFDLVVSVDNLEHVEDDVTAMRALLRALRPGGRLVDHVPGYERRWFVFGRRVNFDVPGHVRPGYRAEELVGKLGDRRVRGRRSTTYTYGLLETFTNNISYSSAAPTSAARCLYALAFPVLLAFSWLGKWLAGRAWGAGRAGRRASARPAARSGGRSDRCGSSSTSSIPPTSTSSATSTTR